MSYMHCYLLALEVEPMKVSVAYETLPLHCTLMHRFLIKLDYVEMDQTIRSVLERTAPITLEVGAEATFGPPPVTVNKIRANHEHLELHAKLKNALDTIGVEYTEPRWVGLGYQPHVTRHGGMGLAEGSKHVSKAIYLIEVKVPENANKKFIRKKYDLN